MPSLSRLGGDTRDHGRGPCLEHRLHSTALSHELIGGERRQRFADRPSHCPPDCPTLLQSGRSWPAGSKSHLWAPLVLIVPTPGPLITGRSGGQSANKVRVCVAYRSAVRPNGDGVR
uniref:Uncharacterized protein n=1 Tax=Plectus sambesii TaxID=2011161 RepID=A0A914XRT4_9BILA